MQELGVRVNPRARISPTVSRHDHVGSHGVLSVYHLIPTVYCLCVYAGVRKRRGGAGLAFTRYCQYQYQYCVLNGNTEGYRLRNID